MPALQGASAALTAAGVAERINGITQSIVALLKEVSMRKLTRVALGCLLLSGGFSVSIEAGEIKGKIEERKGEMEADAEEAKGEAKALREEAKGNDARAKMERAKANLKGTGERAKGKMKEMKAKTE